MQLPPGAVYPAVLSINDAIDDVERYARWVLELADPAGVLGVLRPPAALLGAPPPHAGVITRQEHLGDVPTSV